LRKTKEPLLLERQKQGKTTLCREKKRVLIRYGEREGACATLTEKRNRSPFRGGKGKKKLFLYEKGGTSRAEGKTVFMG